MHTEFCACYYLLLCLSKLLVMFVNLWKMNAYESFQHQQIISLKWRHPQFLGNSYLKHTTLFITPLHGYPRAQRQWVFCQFICLSWMKLYNWNSFININLPQKSSSSNNFCMRIIDSVSLQAELVTSYAPVTWLDMRKRQWHFIKDGASPTNYLYFSNQFRKPHWKTTSIKFISDNHWITLKVNITNAYLQRT